MLMNVLTSMFSNWIAVAYPGLGHKLFTLVKHHKSHVIKAANHILDPGQLGP